MVGRLAGLRRNEWALVCGMTVGSFLRFSLGQALRALFAIAIIQLTAGPAAPQEQTAAAEEEPATAPLSDDALRKLVAPVAFYPDDLLAVVLPASTNPLQVV